jgi:hypothetical protein
MKNKIVLYFCLEHSDYLSDSFLIRLKESSDLTVYEYTGNKIIYNTDSDLNKQHGKAFTIGKILDKEKQLIYSNEIPLDTIDYFIFSSVQQHYPLIRQFYSYLNKKNTIILDGEDSSALFPYYGRFINKLDAWFYPPLHHRFLYFKREWIKSQSFFTKINKYLPPFLAEKIVNQENIRTISFSIPQGKIINKLPQKTKLFPKHIVDVEVASMIEGSTTTYAFETEADYYKDLQMSKFGITTKRAGWDCMRHYEIAANGAVICFKNLEQKPITCAPHGLINGINCISYKDYKDLVQKINILSDREYEQLREKSLEWVKNNGYCNILDKINKS